MVTKVRPLPRRRVPWGVLLRAGVSVALLAWLATSVGADTLQALASVGPLNFGVALVVFASAHLWAAVRLQLLLAAQDRRLGLRRMFALTLLGNFVSNFLPGTVGGDVVKGVALVRDGVDGRTAISSLVLDRALNSLGLVVLAAGTLLGSGLWRLLPPALVAIGLALLAIGLALGVTGYCWRAPVRVTLRRAAQGLGSRGARIASDLNALMKRWEARRGAMLAAFVLSLCVILSSVVAQWLLCRQLDRHIDLVSLAAVNCLLTLLLLVPVSFNGLGMQEIGYVYLLTSLGVGQPAAVALALLSRLLILLTSLPGVLVLALGARAHEEATQ